jgi:hypothetical protein
MAEQDRDLSQFVDQNKSYSSTDLKRHFPSFGDRHEFIGKWFQGGKGDTQPDDVIEGTDEEKDIELKKEGDEDLEGQTSDFEDWRGVEREGKKDVN